MIPPLEFEFTVECSAEHAFFTWTNATRWWPTDHTMSATRDVEVIFEPHEGGRIYERTPNGTEFEWGEVTVWQPPVRLEYLWHIASDRADATEVEVTFVEREASTLVRIEQRGWERLGAGATERRSNNHRGWSDMLPRFVEACG